jgi:RND superfamily putative drug exporter
VFFTPDHSLAIITVYSKSSPQSAATTDLIQRLRTATIPEVLQQSPIHIYVGGSVAIFADFGHVLSGKLPFFIGVVVLLSFLLLMFLFRSLVIPLKAAVMNIFSIGAAFGVVVAGFQWGWAEPLLGTRGGPIEAFLPIMLFAILFGLSMDYEVFLVSRIQEEWLLSHDNAASVRRGLAATGGVITAAATIMFSVFAAFVFGGQRIIQEFGVGLAAAVLVDATIIRSALVPALMQWLGAANWWLPHWLERLLPRFSIEKSDV